MSDGLDVIIVDDDQGVCEVAAEVVNEFYTWGNVYAFSDSDEALTYCLGRDTGVAIFVVDVFLKGMSGFCFLDTIAKKFPSVHHDTIIITGHASEDVVNMCVASGVSHLLEKPVRSYALQLAVRAILAKYLNFAKRIIGDREFAGTIAKL